MKERPILFNSEMVKAILEGRKTQTRRIVKSPQPQVVDKEPKYEKYTWGFWHDKHYPNGKIVKCPYGKPGDRLWIRETWDFRPMAGRTAIIGYKADLATKAFTVPQEFNQLVYEPKRFRPSIHMPRWASRIKLEITDIRVERVQEISELDARDEGLQYDDQNHLDPIGYSAKDRFKILWNSINEKRGYSWESNPWVWVIEFKKIN